MVMKKPERCCIARRRGHRRDPAGNETSGRSRPNPRRERALRTRSWSTAPSPTGPEGKPSRKSLTGRRQGDGGGTPRDLLRRRRPEAAVDAMDSPVILEGQRYGGSIITEAGNDPKVAAPVGIVAFALDEGESCASIEQALRPA